MGTNNYSFNADQQVYMIHLNHTLSHMGTMNNIDPLRGAEFYYTDSSRTVSLSTNRRMISKSLIAAKAEEPLLDVTKKASYASFGKLHVLKTAIFKEISSMLDIKRF